MSYNSEDSWAHTDWNHDGKIDFYDKVFEYQAGHAYDETEVNGRDLDECDSELFYGAFYGGGYSRLSAKQDQHVKPTNVELNLKTEDPLAKIEEITTPEIVIWFGSIIALDVYFYVIELCWIKIVHTILAIFLGSVLMVIITSIRKSIQVKNIKRRLKEQIVLSESLTANSQKEESKKDRQEVDKINHSEEIDMGNYKVEESNWIKKHPEEKNQFLRNVTSPICGRKGGWDVYEWPEMEDDIIGADCRYCDTMIYDNFDKVRRGIFGQEYTDLKEAMQAAPWDKQYYSHPCPYCGKKTVRAAKWEDKMFSVAFWGIFSPKMATRYKCESCGQMWE